MSVLTREVAVHFRDQLREFASKTIPKKGVLDNERVAAVGFGTKIEFRSRSDSG